MTAISVHHVEAQNAKADGGYRVPTDTSSDWTVDQYLEYGKRFEKVKPDSAWLYYEKARVLAEKLNDDRGRSRYISHAIVLLNDEGKYDRALSLSEDMITIGVDLKDTTIQIKGYNDVANDYEYLGSLQDASEHYLTALRLANLLGNKRMEQRLNNNIASVFIELKDYAQANVYASESLRMAIANKDTAEMGSSLINLGLTERHLNRYEEALKHFDQTIQIGKSVHDPTLAADARIDKGVIYTQQNKLDMARREYEQVRSMAEELKMPYYSLYAIFSLAVVDQQEHRYSRAAKFAKQAISIGEKIGAADELREMYDTLSVVLEKMGDLQGALAYRKKYDILNDSTMSANVRTNINRLQIQYKAAQKDKEIAMQKLQLARNNVTIERKNNLLLIFAGGIFILLGLIFFSYWYYRERQKLQEQTIINFRKEREVIHLKAIMQGKDEERRRISAEMHDDIGSALTTIMYLCDNLKGNGVPNAAGWNCTMDKITATSGKVVDKMNEIIWSMNKEYDTLDDLITYIRHNVVELLEDHDIDCHFNVPEQVPSTTLGGEKRRNVYLVVKEAVHNVVKHAEATEVFVDFAIGDELCIHIRDNGRGIDMNNRNRFSNGLKNMQRRMEAIGGKFSIRSEKGTAVNISLPLDKVCGEVKSV
ncbi:MAG TPA: tetratricopeptide repeat protein [Balneolales bacterium]|nr:tetratricopeptide repeat protein [Balneolales bacterium]